MSTSRFTSPALMMMGLLAACGDTDARAPSSDDQFAQPQELQGALQLPIVDCQTSAADCIAKAAGDQKAASACNDTLVQCLQGAATKGQSITQAVDACRQAGFSCVQAGTDPVTCATNYESCSDQALHGSDAGSPAPSSGAGLPGLPTLPGLGDGGILSGLPSGSGLPSLPSGGGLPSLPSGGGLPSLPTVDAGALTGALPAPLQCITAMQQCVATNPTAAQQCADTARMCLQIP